MSISDQSPESAPQPLLVSAAGAADLLGVHRATIYDLLGSGAIPSVKIGRRRMISLASLEEFVRVSERFGL